MDSPVTRGLGNSLLHFQGALCDGLADYNAQIQALKAEMEDATRIADALRCWKSLLRFMFENVILR